VHTDRIEVFSTVWPRVTDTGEFLNRKKKQDASSEEKTEEDGLENGQGRKVNTKKREANWRQQGFTHNLDEKKRKGATVVYRSRKDQAGPQKAAASSKGEHCKSPASTVLKSFNAGLVIGKKKFKRRNTMTPAQVPTCWINTGACKLPLPLEPYNRSPGSWPNLG